MKILVVAATAFEIAPLIAYLKAEFEEKEAYHFQKKALQMDTLLTGVGLTHTAFALAKVLAYRKYDLLINAGIAGAFNRDFEIGEVIEVVSDRFADLGVEEANGAFSDIFELGLMDADQFPFSGGKLENPAPGNFLKPAEGLSVNKVHGFAPSIAAVQKRYSAAIETMEGAAFFYTCLMEKQAFLAIRAISNYVEPRNRENWNIPLAIENLNQVLIEMSQNWIQEK